MEPVRTAYCLGHAPEQFSDLITLLLNDDSVIFFELPRGSSVPEEHELWTVAEYRRHIGQGRNRPALDFAVTLAKADLSSLD